MIRHISRAFSTNIKFKQWKLGKLNHVAIAVHDLNKAIQFYKDVLKGEPQPDHGVNTVFVDLGNTKIELLSVLGENSPIQNFLNKNSSGGVHHICIEALKELKNKGIRSLTENTKIGAHGKPVVFLHPKDCGGILLELEEK